MSRSQSGLGAITVDNVSSHMIPVLDDQYDLGSSEFRWQDIYASGNIRADGLTASLPVKTNSSKVLTTASINLAGSEVTGILPNANTTATSANTASAIVARDGSGNFSANTATLAGLTASLPVKTDASKVLTTGAIDLASAEVTGILPNSNTTATSANTASAIVARDASGVFSAGRIGLGTTPESTHQLHIASTGNTHLWLESDTDNSGSDNSTIRFTNDQNRGMSTVGLFDNNRWLTLKAYDQTSGGSAHISFMTGGIISSNGTGTLPTETTQPTERMRINNNGTFTINGTMNVTGSVNPTGVCSFSSDFPLSLGAQTVNTAKTVRVRFQMYNGSNLNCGLVAVNNSTSNRLLVGGGCSTSRAATQMEFWLASDIDTDSGSKMATMTTSGLTLDAGTLTISGLTASLPVKTDASKVLTTSAINLASAEVTGVLPIANGGTNSSSALTNGKVIVSSGGSLVEASGLTYSSNLLGGLKLTTTGGTASELDYHETTSINYTFPSSGNPIVQTAYTYYATRIGNLVTLHFPFLTATGNNTSNNLVIQDLPSRFWPSADENTGSMTVVDVFVNDTHTQGVCWIEGLTGSITFGIGMTCDAWPASTGVHGIGEFAVSYIKY